MDPASFVKLASNENPLGASPKALEAARAALTDAWLYPENSAYFLRNKLAERLNIGADQITVSAGSNELLYILGDLFIEPGVEVVMGECAFVATKIATLLYGGTPVEVPLDSGFKHDLDAMRAAITDRTRIVYLPDPNNPTGTACDEAEIIKFARSLPDHVLFVYDEAYVEYREKAPDLRPLIREGRKILCTRTFSKIYGLAGLRVGYGFSDPELASLLNRVRHPFNVSSIALAAAAAALDDHDFVERSREANRLGLKQLEEGLAALGLDFTHSEANFILVRVKNAATVNQELQKKGLIVRPLKAYGLSEHLRISVGTSAQNKRLLDALRDLGVKGVDAPSAH